MGEYQKAPHKPDGDSLQHTDNNWVGLKIFETGQMQTQKNWRGEIKKRGRIAERTKGRVVFLGGGKTTRGGYSKR